MWKKGKICMRKQLGKWTIWLVNLCYNFECDGLIELSNEKLSDNKLSDNNVASEYEQNRSLLNESQSRMLLFLRQLFWFPLLFELKTISFGSTPQSFNISYIELPLIQTICCFLGEFDKVGFTCINNTFIEKIIWVIGPLRRTVLATDASGNLCGSHLQSQVVLLVSWKFKNPAEQFDWSVDRVAFGKCVMWLAVKTCAENVKWIINKVLLFPIE